MFGQAMHVSRCCSVIRGSSSALEYPSMASDSSVLFEAGDSDDSVILEAVPVRARRGPYELQTQSSPFLCAIVADPSLTETLSQHECDNVAPELEHRFYLLGLVSICWHLLLERLPDRRCKVMMGISKRLHATSVPYAWVDYRMHGSCEVQPTLLLGDLSSNAKKLRSIRSVIEASETLKVFANTCASPVHDFVLLGPQLAACLFGGCIALLFSGPMVQKNRGWPFTHTPSFKRVRVHVESLAAPTLTRPSAQLARVHAPAGEVSFLIDPMDYLRFLDVTRLLRSAAFLANAAKKTVGL
jgi:hypothetical protein